METRSMSHQLTLTDEGAKLFGEVTAANVGKRLPIVYDGEQISNPQVQEAINGGSAQISGMKSYEEAETLATQIRIGSLSLKLEELESSVVGAQLGSQAITSSLKAAAIGLAIVMVFMIVMYAVPGVAAALALMLYTALVIVTLYLFDITLTLPGYRGYHSGYRYGGGRQYHYFCAHPRGDRDRKDRTVLDEDRF